MLEMTYRGLDIKVISTLKHYSAEIMITHWVGMMVSLSAQPFVQPYCVYKMFV